MEEASAGSIRRTGQWVWQHDPDFVDGDSFTVFDNDYRDVPHEADLHSRIVAIDCRDVDALLSGAGNIRAVRPRQVDSAEVPQHLLWKADQVYRRLHEAALN